ncbi:MAG: peptidoglycan DD-metalloendopeptidase family protein [Pseudomonadota bacterium]
MFQSILVASLIIFLSACQSNPPAPVIDRLPQTSKSQSPPASTNNNGASKSSQSNKTAGKDWRPDSYTVKKGDTLFSIGLEYGLEYQEIAAANNISEPYSIHIGQKLNLPGVKTKSDSAENGQPTQTTAEDGVIITPIKTEQAVVETKPQENKSTEIKPTQSSASPILSEPKSIREPYSVEAFNRSALVKSPENKVADSNQPVNAKTVENKPADAKPGDDEAITWQWPTQGKVTASFNEATNKGIDIAGTTGQAIHAASMGKVIYSGSDLRGYGKLVIVKHNKTYLSVYAHNSKIIVKEGQLVAAGQKIAEMGNTDSNTVKLHFEIRRLGKSVDPARYLNQN